LSASFSGSVSENPASKYSPGKVLFGISARFVQCLQDENTMGG
jgi:hypothetical protein